MKKIIAIIAVLFFMQTVSAQEVKIPGTQSRQITSSIVSGQEYQLHIMLPGGYANSNKTYPVVYLMDSQWDFPLVSALYGEQYYDGFIPQMIIVGVTWGGINPNPDSLRARDYTPTSITTNIKGAPQTGGADKFLSFMKEELFPFIEKNYRVDKNDRTLMGCSLGGLLTLYALFTQPGMFQRYVATSPAFGWDNEVLYQYEKKYAFDKSNPPAKLFMCAGGVETSIPGFEKLTKFLYDRHYPSLEMESRVLENTGHSGTKGEGYARGLQFVFKRPALQLSAAALEPYAGSYKMNNGETINVKVENGSLCFFSGITKYTLLAASATDFYITSFFFNLHFIKNDAGTISGFQLNRFNETEYATKIN
jgi:predicted alpha/beta superfamily hydrolase